MEILLLRLIFFRVKDEYTKWVHYCPYENRITVHCKNGKINPYGTLEVWESDSTETGGSGIYNHNEKHHIMGAKYVTGFRWTHFDLDGQDGYFDAYISNGEIGQRTEGDDYVEIYGLFRNVCSNIQGFNLTNDLLKSEFTF
uniref:Uncharacterized protein n=1 Tax=Panagrolaimus sp. JU765 TaxID=591449 RepID=A0AC34QCQ5_9BILA